MEERYTQDDGHAMGKAHTGMEWTGRQAHMDPDGHPHRQWTCNGQARDGKMCNGKAMNVQRMTDGRQKSEGSGMHCSLTLTTGLAAFFRGDDTAAVKVGELKSSQKGTRATHTTGSDFQWAGHQ